MEENIKSRAEAYLEYALKKNNNYPKPVSRQEYYLLSVAEEVRNGGADQATITEAVNSYLEKNPVSSTFDEYLEVTNAIGNLTEGTQLYNMDIKEIIKLMTTVIKNEWNGMNILYGTTDTSPSDLETIYATDFSITQADGSLDYVTATINCNNKRILFATPTSCPFKKIIDQNGLDVTKSFTEVQVTLILSGGMTLDYLAYVQNDICGVTDFNIYLYFA